MISPRGVVVENGTFIISYWMLCRYPKEPETLSISNKQFGGSFEDFFGFPLPTNGKDALQRYAAFRDSRSMNSGIVEEKPKNHQSSQNQTDDLVQQPSGNAESSTSTSNDSKRAQWAEKILGTPRFVPKSTIHSAAKGAYERGVKRPEDIEKAARLLLDDRYRNIPETAEEMERERVFQRILGEALDNMKPDESKE